MSVAPDWASAIDPATVKTLLNGDALPKLALTSGLAVADDNATAKPADTSQELAEQAARLANSDAAIRVQINGLAAPDRDIFDKAVLAAQILINAWHDGTLQGVDAFKSKILTDQTSLDLALANNLMFAAISVQGLVSKVLLSLVKNVVTDTLKSKPSDKYDGVIGPIIDDAKTRLNHLHDDMIGRADVLLYPELSRTGLANFEKLDLPQKNDLLWRSIFTSITFSSADYINPTRNFVLSNLQSADKDAIEKLALYQRIWNTSLRILPATGFEGNSWAFDQERWKQQTDDPVWLWTGVDISDPSFPWYFLSPVSDPCPSPNKRAAALLRRAIDSRWPIGP